MKNYLKTLAVATSVLVAGCSNSNVNNYEHYVNTFIGEEKLVPLESIDAIKAVDLFVLNNQHIALIAQNNKYYLLTTPDNCENMKFAKRLAVLNEDKGVVKVNSDKVVRLGDKYTECMITGMYKLHSVQFDSLVLAYKSSFSNPKGSPQSSPNYPRGI